MEAIILVLVSLVLFVLYKKRKKRDVPNHLETTSCHVSVVIITLNEELQIRECIEHVASFNPPCKEIIVSDGGSVDQTVSIVQSLVTDGHDIPPLSLVQCKEKGRARQMNAGSRACTGDSVMFIHADSRPPLDSIRHIRTSLSSPGTIVGGFKSRISITDEKEKEKVLWFPTLHQYLGFDLYPCLLRHWQYLSGLR